MVKRLSIILCCVGLVTATQPATSGTIDDLSAPLRKDVECMRNVLLKDVPGIDMVNVETITVRGSVLPIVSYRAVPDWKGYRITVAFQAEVRCLPQEQVNCCPQKFEHACFDAALPGRIDFGHPPNDGGADVVTRKWKEQCGVEADAFFA